MRQIICLLGTFVLIAASCPAQSRLPARGGTETFPAAATLSFETLGETNCVALLTGTGEFRRGDATGPTSNRVIATEIVSLNLTGKVAGLGNIQLVAGSNIVGRASTGQITSTNNLFPAESTFDVFVLIGLPGAFLVNTTALRLTNSITASPAISQTYTNIGPVDLADADDTNTVVGSLIQFALTPAARGSTRHLGISASVTGTNDLGALSLGVCPGTNGIAVASLRGQSFSGPLTPNADCDQALDTNILFAAKWNTNVRAPDWRGYHTGRFILFRIGDGGKTNLVGFGTMDGSNGVGTRRAPLELDAENCDSCYRFEGKLKGRITERGPLAGARLEATYAGEHLDSSGDPIGCCPPPATPPQGAFRLTLDGVAVTRCP